jgi:hypothetical protein
MALRHGAGAAVMGRCRRLSPAGRKIETSMARAGKAIPQYTGGGLVENRLRSSSLARGTFSHAQPTPGVWGGGGLKHYPRCAADGRQRPLRSGFRARVRLAFGV